MLVYFILCVYHVFKRLFLNIAGIIRSRAEKKDTEEGNGNNGTRLDENGSKDNDLDGDTDMVWYFFIHFKVIFSIDEMNFGRRMCQFCVNVRNLFH